MVSLPDHLAASPVGKDPLPRAVIAQHQRQRVLAAAASVFADQGYTATTVDDLVVAAGIGVGSFYSLCNGKEECLVALYDEAVDEAVRAVKDAIATESAVSWADQVCIGLRELLDFVSNHPKEARIALVEIQTAGAEAFERYGANLDLAAKYLSHGRKTMAVPRELPPNLEQTTVSGVAWLLHRYLSMGKAESAPELLEDLARLILEPYLGEAGARQTIAQMLLAPPG